MEDILAALEVAADPVEGILEEVPGRPGEVRLDEEEHGPRLAQSAPGGSPRAECSDKCCSRHPHIRVSCAVEWAGACISNKLKPSRSLGKTHNVANGEGRSLFNNSSVPVLAVETQGSDIFVTLERLGEISLTTNKKEHCDWLVAQVAMKVESSLGRRGDGVC